MNIKRILFIAMAAMLSLSLLSGCGKKVDKKETASSTGSNVIQKSEPQEGDTSANKHYEVQLDERDEESAYQYSKEDISYIDTVTGGSVFIGMTIEEVDAIAGASMLDDTRYRIYDGLVAQFDEKGKAAALVVSGGLFINEAQSTRFVTPRGVSLYTSRDDFAKAYGDIALDNAESAIRYFMIDGDKVEYLGEKLTQEQQTKHAGKIFMQEFMFDKESNKINSMRLINIDIIE